MKTAIWHGLVVGTVVAIAGLTQATRLLDRAEKLIAGAKPRALDPAAFEALEARVKEATAARLEVEESYARVAEALRGIGLDVKYLTYAEIGSQVLRLVGRGRGR